MASVKLPNDATIRDILALLKNAEGYLCGVLQNMTAVRREKGSAFVRIGTTGRGIVPHYRVEPESLGEIANGDADSLFVAFNGSNHARLEEWGFDELRDNHWSSQSLEFEEVQRLLGDVRRPASKHAKRTSETSAPPKFNG